MIVHEPKERVRREVKCRLLRRGRPNRTRHRDEIIVPKAVRVPLPLQEAPDRLLRVARSKERDCGRVEAQDVEHHAVLGWVEEVEWLGKERREGSSSPFVGSPVARDGEGHVRGEERDREVVEEAEQVRVGHGVETGGRGGLVGSPGEIIKWIQELTR